MTSLWETANGCLGGLAGAFRGREGTVNLGGLASGTTLPVTAEELRGRCVLLATGDQLATALALLELDGVARRLVLCTPDLTPGQLAEVSEAAQADVIVAGENFTGDLPGGRRIAMRPQPTGSRLEHRATELTEWILLTSGTTGAPKLVVHTLSSLAGALSAKAPAPGRSVWSTFYDIRRYGGLQIYLRAILSGSELVLSSAGESTADFLGRAAAAGVTHISGTPSHWRRALMSGAARRIDPAYVRLSGEVADQSILDGLRETYPNATIAHAFASTEAGVGFDVGDGLAGFPRCFADGSGAAPGRADLRVADGTLRIRSPGIGARYVGGEPVALADADGFVDTGDLVELVDDRYYFRGRRGGVINVGGLKVYPEEIEAVLNADPRVRMSRVRARRNPITGAIPVADVVLLEGDMAARDPAQAERLKTELLCACRRALSAHKVPAVLRLVPTLEVTESGKLARPNA